MEARKWLAGASIGLASLGACSPETTVEQAAPSAETIASGTLPTVEQVEIKAPIFQIESGEELLSKVQEALLQQMPMAVAIDAAAYYWWTSGRELNEDTLGVALSIDNPVLVDAVIAGEPRHYLVGVLPVAGDCSFVLSAEEFNRNDPSHKLVLIEEKIRVAPLLPVRVAGQIILRNWNDENIGYISAMKDRMTLSEFSQLSIEALNGEKDNFIPAADGC
jgi:hypothetical protein